MDKSIFKSVTAWGGLIMLIPTLLKFVGVDVSATEAQAGFQMAQDVIVRGSELVGFIMVIIGRFRAGGVSVMGG